jgi:hypothetical protein
MAIDIFGFIVKPEIGIGDIVATIGLIITAVIFYVGYRRTRRNDQLKLFIEHYRRLDELYEEIKIHYNTKIKWGDISDKEETERWTVFLSQYTFLRYELQIMTYLKEQRDVSPEIMTQIAPSIIELLEEMKQYYDTSKSFLAEQQKPKLLAQLGEDDFKDLKEAWESDRQSKLGRFFGRLKEFFHM